MAKNRRERKADINEPIKIFAAVAPPFEAVGLQEFQELTKSRYLAEMHAGGYSFVMSLAEVKHLQAHLKVPTRLLARLAEFRVRDFPKFYQKCSKIFWNDYLVEGQYELQVDCKKSRLNNEKRVADCFADALKTHFQAFQPRKQSRSYAHRIFLRINADQCSLSLDLSGEPLYKRSLHRKVYKASIRENLIYALLYPYKSAMMDKDFIDPCCGSASSAWEVLHWHKAMQREFAIDFLELAKSDRRFSKEELGIRDVHLNDHNPAALAVAKENLSDFARVHFHQEDVLTFMRQAPKRAFLFANLPYGKQVKLEPPLADWLKAFRCSDNLVVYKSENKANSQRLRFYNGGILVEAEKWEGSHESV